MMQQITVEITTLTLITVLVISEPFVPNRQKEEGTICHCLLLWNTIFLGFPARAETLATLCSCRGYYTSSAIQSCSRICITSLNQSSHYVPRKVRREISRSQFHKQILTVTFAMVQYEKSSESREATACSQLLIDEWGCFSGFIWVLRLVQFSLSWLK